MSDLLQDVDDALRREKAEKFWRENGPYVLGGAILLVLMTGVFTVYNNWKLKNDTRQTALIVAAMQDPAPATALQKAAADLKGNHKAMALLQAAGAHAQAGKTAEAVALFRQVADDKGLPTLWRDLATLNAVRAEWGVGVDKARAQTLFNSLKPLTEKGNAWQMEASVQAAMIAGDSLGDTKTAVELLRAPLSDVNVPAPLKEKAKLLDHLYLNTTTTPKTNVKG